MKFLIISAREIREKTRKILFFFRAFSRLFAGKNYLKRAGSMPYFFYFVADYSFRRIEHFRRLRNVSAGRFKRILNQIAFKRFDRRNQSYLRDRSRNFRRLQKSAADDSREITFESQTRTARSTTFSSSRTFPGK